MKNIVVKQFSFFKKSLLIIKIGILPKMNKPEQIEIHINQIDFNDRSYIFTFESRLSKLITSIKNIGILNSPILEKRADGNFRIVSGLKRILALRHLKIDQLTAQIYYSTNTEPKLELFLFNLYENIGTRHLDIIEKAIIINKLINLFRLSADKVITEFFPLLDLGINKLVFDRYMQIVQLEDNLKRAVAEDFLSFDIAVALPERSRVEGLAIFQLFQKLRLGKNRQKEFFRLLQELSEINNQSIDQLLLNNEIQDVLSNDKITPPRKTDHIKEILKQMRYPLFANVEKNFQKLKKDLKLPPNIILRPPPFFESEKYTIEFSFKNQSDFRKLTEILISIADQNKLAELEFLV